VHARSPPGGRTDAIHPEDRALRWSRVTLSYSAGLLSESVVETHLACGNYEDVALRTIVADDDALARRSIRDALEGAGITVVAEAAIGREAVELAIFYRPDVVVMDHTLPGIDGIEATRRLREHDPSIRVVILVEAHDEDLGLRALRAGAVGYLSKEIDPDALPRMLRGVRDGEAAISRRFAMTLVEHYRASSIAGEGLRPVRSSLTAREWEVLDLLTAGLSADQVADTLVLSTETIRSHMKRVYRKLDVHSRQDALREASRLRGLVVHATDPHDRPHHPQVERLAAPPA
jgi:DNA-binding NarL/FixJ family response regulator